MKTRSILPFAVLGLLLAVLFASSCGGGGGFSDDQFGGPYPFASTAKKLIEKKLDFECYVGNDLSISKAGELNGRLLAQSIKANKPAPHGDEMQKYNYVVDTKGKIIVAKWDVENVAQTLANAMVIARNANDPCKGRRCEKVGDFPPEGLEGLEGAMVNWFPEAKEATDRQSPCWLDTANRKGVSDAISKHLMLAQGERTTISQFQWQDWMVADVAYAGEIVVDLRNCAYWVTEDSGTYKPDSGKMRARAQQHFAKQLSIDEIFSEVPELCP